MVNIAIKLTLIRLLSASLVVPFLLYWLLPHHNIYLNSGMALLFIVVSLTDMLDGYYARRLAQTSVMGSLLDPIADKLLVTATLVSLLAVRKIFFYWVIVFIARELLVTGLRLIAGEFGYPIKVSFVAKIKTTFQYFFLVWVILNPAQQAGMNSPVWNGTELGLLTISLLLSIITAYQYYRHFIVRYTEERNEI